MPVCKLSAKFVPFHFCRNLALICLLAGSVGGQHGFAMAQGTCPIPQERPPCAVAGLVAPTEEPDLDPGISNPVHRQSGEKFLFETDLPDPVDGAFPPFVRIYRYSSQSNSYLGVHWQSEYDVRLHKRSNGWRLVFANGRRLDFNQQGMPAATSQGRLHADERNAAEQGRQAGPDPAATQSPPAAPTATAVHHWDDSKGKRLSFDALGQLVALQAPGRPPIWIERHLHGPWKGLVARIHRENRHLQLHYRHLHGRPILDHLTTPWGVFRYKYDETVKARLLQVQRPDGMSRVYHYEPGYQSGHRGAVTGISIVNRQGQAWRARSWAYDRQGRVRRAAPGPFGALPGELHFSYDMPIDSDSGQQAQGSFVRSRHGEISHTQWSNGDQGSIATRRFTPADSCAGCQAHAYSIQRDRQGRLSAIGDLQLQRHPDGSLKSLHQKNGGWPGLVIHFDSSGRRQSWFSTLIGHSHTDYDSLGRLRQLRRANGSQLDIQYDQAHRPVLLHYQQDGHHGQHTRLNWSGQHLIRLENPNETETLARNPAGQIRSRRVERSLPEGVLRYQEHFHHDRSGRLRQHELPEGGRLHYEWGNGHRLHAIHWEDPAGTRQTIIRKLPGRAGYRYGNGLHMTGIQTRNGLDAAAARTDVLLLKNQQKLLWAEYRQQDAYGQSRRRLQFWPTLQQGNAHEYHYDHRGRLAWLRARTLLPEEQEQEPVQDEWFSWNDDGSLRQRRHLGGKPAAPSTIQRDAAGLPLSMGRWQLHYNAQLLLARAMPTDGSPTVHYRHNARGQLIRQERGNTRRERLYHDNRLVAIWEHAKAQTPVPTARPETVRTLTGKDRHFASRQRYIFAHDVPVGLLHTDAQGHTHLYFIHTDALGTPVLASDQHGAIVWAAAADALGQVQTMVERIPMPLRFTGQDEDPYTGWHHNVFRHYLPTHGHYLEPDPLGPVPGQQALGYAAQQPMRYSDPLGLILLAFDGTRYGRENLGNIWKFSRHYQDGPVYYHAGPGNNAYIDWDAVTASSSNQILRNQWQSLLNGLEKAQREAAQTTPIDLLGFSRGAALARDFANRIVQHTQDGWFSYDDPVRGSIGVCVDLRFMGLFDTVAQFGLLGAANAGFDLGIAGAWQWVAHAVAMHEFRMAFPLVMAARQPQDNIIEMPFIGAHADIGGGHAIDDQRQALPGGDLANVALEWMRWQAMATMLQLSEADPADRHSNRPLVHDDRLPMTRILQDSDRVLQDESGASLGLQGRHPQLGNEQRAVFESFIQRVENWQAASGNVVGTVNMELYQAWLNEQSGLPMTTPAGTTQANFP